LNLKILIITIISLVLLATVGLFVIAYLSKSAVANGLVGDRLTQCPGTPNCVCSEFESDVEHYIEPLIISNADAAQVMARITTIVGEMGGAIQAEKTDYLAATFTSSIFRFIDDLEIRIDTEQQVIHLRSASRVGRGDGGVNRKRVERLKQLFHLREG
jgi:uncharacterized protein (DUF1499 family)